MSKAKGNKVEPVEEKDITNTAEPDGVSDGPTKAKPPQSKSHSDAHVSDEDVKEAILLHASNTCCYGSTAAKETSILEMQSGDALHYRLESFTEARETYWRELGYSGQGGETATDTTPDTWSIPVRPTALFCEERKELEVPNTSQVKVCQDCAGQGRKQCVFCRGAGRSRCSSCSGSGSGGSHPCSNCSGTGQASCSPCHGSGYQQCTRCSGKGKLRRFLMLEVLFKNYVNDAVVQKLDLGFPDKLVTKAKGDNAISEEAPNIDPLRNHPLIEVHKISEDLIKKHQTKHAKENIIRQRHSLRVIPITKCACKWKEKTFNTWVYGSRNQAYMPQYPQRCCWCCNCCTIV